MRTAPQLILMLILLIAATCSAGIVLDRQPTHNGGQVSDTEFFNDANQPTFQQLADDVLLPTTNVIRQARFWGFYGSSISFPPEPPPFKEVFRLRLYEPRPTDSLPGTILYEDSFANPPRTPTGFTIGGGPGDLPEYVYELNLNTPFVLQANTPYWLEIVQLGNLQSRFRWESSPQLGTPLAFVNPITSGDWQSISNSNTAFQLLTIPEPSSISLLIGGLALIARLPREERNT